MTEKPETNGREPDYEDIVEATAQASYYMFHDSLEAGGRISDNSMYTLQQIVFNVKTEYFTDVWIRFLEILKEHGYGDLTSQILEQAKKDMRH